MGLFIISKNWREKNKYPSIGEWVTNCYTHTMDHSSSIKETNYDKCNNMDLKALCWVKEASFKGSIAYDSVYIISYKKQNCETEKKINGQRGLRWESIWLQKGSRRIWGVMELFCVLVMVMMAQIYTRVKTHRPIHTHIYAHTYTYKRILTC